jgi:hypothetical protein
VNRAVSCNIFIALIRDAPEHAPSQCERFCTALPKQVSDSIGGYKEKNENNQVLHHTHTARGGDYGGMLGDGGEVA